MQNKIAFSDALQTLTQSGKEFRKMFEHGTLLVELYKPDTIDKQKPHTRDEVCFIASGAADFMLEDETAPVKAGDFLFVPARANHKFIRFTPDFSTWVLFYGPEGGEAGSPENFL